MEICEKKANFPIYIKDRIVRRKLHKYVDRIAILSGEDEVFFVKTIQISNGYDFEKQTIKKVHYGDAVIHIVATAIFKSWHGYERLIKGLSDYYIQGGSRKINLHFAGDGSELENYKKMAKELSVSGSCIFYGLCNKEQLDAIYDKCDLAAASFGVYKKNLSFSRELKSREYIAKGLPMLCTDGLDLLDIDGLKPYLLNFANNDSDVDFNRIVSFYDSLYSGKSEGEVLDMHMRIRDIGKRSLNMDAAMKHVIEYIKE